VPRASGRSHYLPPLLPRGMVCRTADRHITSGTTREYPGTRFLAHGPLPCPPWARKSFPTAPAVGPLKEVPFVSDPWPSPLSVARTSLLLPVLKEYEVTDAKRAIRPQPRHLAEG
jgi:hypothetical protein